MSDTADIAKFIRSLSNNQSRLITEEYFEWKINENPYMQGEIFLEKRAGDVIGSFTITPKKISVYGEEILAAETGDTFTHPQFQRKGINTKLRNSCIEFALKRGFQVVYGTPNRLSLAAGLKSERKICPYANISLMTKHLRISTSKLKFALVQILHMNIKPLLSLFFINELLKKISSYSRHNAVKKDFSVLFVEKFTDQVDGLWGNPRYIFSTVRDNTYINWRYFMNPDKYQVIVAKNGNNYLGYLVIKISKTGRNKKIASICDFITYNDRIDVFYALVLEAEKAIKKENVDYTQLWCIESSIYYQTLLDMGYYDHKNTSERPVVVYSSTYYGKKLLEEDGKWHFTMSALLCYVVIR